MMIGKNLWKLSSSAVLLAVTALVSISYSYTAGAHKTGTELRSRSACAGLAKPKQRAACKACISRRTAKHHYHPKRWTGKRCMRNGAKPWYKFGKGK